jgi:hypothetical protein
MEAAVRRGKLQTLAVAAVCGGGAAVNVAVSVLCLGMAEPFLHGTQLAVTVVLCWFLYRGAGWARWVFVGVGSLTGVLGVPVGALLLVAGRPMGAYVLAMGGIYLACALLLLVLRDVRAYFRAPRPARRAGAAGPRPGRGDLRLVEVASLRPNNWYVHAGKLARAREAWREGRPETLPPVLVSEIDGEPCLIDGHARTLAAWENGVTHLMAVVADLESIEGSKALYRHIHRRGPAEGVERIADLSGRIVGPEEHERLWVGYCEAWLEEHGE